MLPAVATSRPTIGMLAVSEPKAAENRRAGVETVVVSAHWSALQPKPNAGLSPTAVQNLKTKIRHFRSSGLQIVLSPGFQYVPAWVFKLDPDSRFVDQYGTVWVGGPGEDVPDAVWNPVIRKAQDRYLTLLGDALKGQPISAIRVGGLLDGELRLPIGSRTRTSYWGFSRWARNTNPLAKLQPGQVTERDAKLFLRWYLNSLTRYQDFIAKLTARAFPGVLAYVLYPNVGVRPGQLEAAAAGRLNGTTPAERNRTLTQGLDWQSQIPALPKRGFVAQLTELDNRGTGGTVQTEAPVSFASRIARPAGIRVAGENRGSNNLDELLRCLRYSTEYRLQAVFWMSESDLYSKRSDRPSHRQFKDAVSRLNGPRWTIAGAASQAPMGPWPDRPRVQVTRSGQSTRSSSPRWRAPARRRA